MSETPSNHLSVLLRESMIGTSSSSSDGMGFPQCVNVSSQQGTAAGIDAAFMQLQTHLQPCLEQQLMSSAASTNSLSMDGDNDGQPDRRLRSTLNKRVMQYGQSSGKWLIWSEEDHVARRRPNLL